MHHTKNKGDIAVAKVIADLLIKGLVPCLPLSEHQRYDLIAVDEAGKALKVQVKYASLKPNGTVDIKFRTSWADRNGVHTRRYIVTDFDYYAIYCHEKDAILYVPNQLNCPKTIRFSKAANNQQKSIKWANEFFEIHRESSETIRCTPEMAKT